MYPRIVFLVGTAYVGSTSDHIWMNGSLSTSAIGFMLAIRYFVMAFVITAFLSLWLLDGLKNFVTDWSSQSTRPLFCGFTFSNSVYSFLQQIYT